ncbi:unnamed protein product [Caenorhabditis nigoni]|uniref:Uncharacterized protein n=1 Tax=Caenorhabditis nigoni TaxID=1611254 RepID=A0A2G5SF74_9PELO|nr:hypothetical protein B9Z55_027710 [Caenorhabditis nigoni]
MVHQRDVKELAFRIRISATAGAAQMMMQHQRRASDQHPIVQWSTRSSRGGHTEIDVHHCGRRVPISFDNADDVTTLQQCPTAHTAAVDYRNMTAHNG